MNENGNNGLKKLDPLAINGAMRYIYDQMERCLIYDYVILGDASRAIFEGRQIDTNKIEVGIKGMQFTPEVLSLFKEWGYYKGTDLQWHTSFEGVPITFKIIKRKYNFLKNPDTKFYDVDEYHLPNPFEKYWKMRAMIV